MLPVKKRLDGAAAGKLQAARLQVQPAEDRSLSHWAVHELDEESAHRSVLAVPVQDADAGTCLQGIPHAEGPTEDPAGRGSEGNWEGEMSVYDPGSPPRYESQPVGTGLPLRHRCRKAGPAPAGEDARIEASE